MEGFILEVIKKDGTIEAYNEQKIVNACNLAADRAMVVLTPTDYSSICNRVMDIIYEEGLGEEPINVFDMHTIVVSALMELFPSVGKTYLEYRNYKLDFVKMLDEIYKKSQSIRYIGDVSNANSDATLVSTQRSLIYGELNKASYKKFFLNKEELQAANDGYIYIHDMKDRLDAINCCLFDVNALLKNGFEMGNIWYNEPKTLDVAFDVIGDIVLSAASQQYGGFTLPRIDIVLAPYAEKSYKKYYEEYQKESYDIYCDAMMCGKDCDGIDGKILDKMAHEYAMKKVKKEMEQGFQGWEYKFNTVASSRGDYPFTSISFGIGTSVFETMASECALRVRMKGQGKESFKKPVLFPKLTFLYDEELHGEGKPLEWLFDIGVECSKKAMYPDWLSLSGEGYIPSMYKKYGQVVSLMGRVAAHVKLCELFA